MNFVVILPDPVVEKIHGWGLQQSILLKFLDAMSDRLSTKDQSDFRQVVAPVRCSIDKYAIKDEESGLLHRFFVWFNDTEAEGARIVIDVRWLAS